MQANGSELMSSRMHGSEEALATFACARARTLETPCCLVGGLGMGFTLRAAGRTDAANDLARKAWVDAITALCDRGYAVLDVLAAVDRGDAREVIVALVDPDTGERALDTLFLRARAQSRSSEQRG